MKEINENRLNFVSGLCFRPLIITKLCFLFLIFSMCSCQKSVEHNTLTVKIDPTEGGSVILNPVGGTYEAGTTVVMKVSANSGYFFAGWSGDATGSMDSVTIVMDGNKTVTAAFSLNSTDPKYPIASYLLNETGDSIVADNSGNGHKGIVRGTYSWTTGRFGNGLSLNSADENTGYVIVTDASTLDFGSNNFSVGYWVFKRAHTSEWSNIWGVDKWNTGTSPGTNEWALNLQSTGSNDIPSFLIESGNTVYQANATSSIYNVWHHIVGIRDGSTIRIYVDGIQEGTASCGSVAVNNAGRSLYIGNSYMNNSLPNAIFDNVRIYNYALSDTEVLVLYNSLGNN